MIFCIRRCNSYRSVRIIIVVIMIDAVVLVIVAAAAAVILLPPERFIRLFNGFNPSGGDAGNRIDGRTRFRVLRPAADCPLLSSLLLGNHGEHLLLLCRLHEGHHYQVSGQGEGNALHRLGRGRLLLMMMPVVMPSRRRPVPAGHRLVIADGLEGRALPGAGAGAAAAQIARLEEERFPAFHALVKPLGTRSADVGVAARQYHRRPLVVIERLEAYYAVEREGDAAGHDWRA
mmetsp:Transcript_37888/g.77114  ORF Transcript_37888/g.77114 Transcript_37888/m.77114 type:complete len:232 (-) Transcript_37888:246-941(-)